MLTLVWSSEQGIRDEVLSTFCTMFFMKREEESDKMVPQQPQIVAVNLVSLTVGACLNSAATQRCVLRV